MIYLCIGILALISILATLFCKTVCREEDEERLLAPNFKLVSMSKPFLILTWFFAAFISIVLFVFRDDPEGLVPLALVGAFATGALMTIGIFLRSSYYTDDGEYLTYVKHKNVAWSLNWNQIAHVYRRVVSTGETTAVFYDIVTTDGEVIKGLPAVSGRMLKRHKKIEKYHVVPFVVVLVFIIVVLAALLLIFSK